MKNAEKNALVLSSDAACKDAGFFGYYFFYYFTGEKG